MYTPVQLVLQREVAEEFRSSYFYNSLAILNNPQDFIKNGTDCFGLSCQLEKMYAERGLVYPYEPFASYATNTKGDELVHTFMGIYFQNRLVDFLDPSNCILIPAIGSRLNLNVEFPRIHRNYCGTDIVLQDSIFKIIEPTTSITTVNSSPFQVHKYGEYFIYPLVKRDDHVVFSLRVSDVELTLRLPDMRYMEFEWGDSLESPELLRIIEKFFYLLRKYTSPQINYSEDELLTEIKSFLDIYS